jgi:parvulin-like peptidyl-prolyl isomerase
MRTRLIFQGLGVTIGMITLNACSSSTNPTSAVAKVNGKYIPLSAFEAQSKRLSEVPGMNMDDLGKKRELLKDLVKQELLYQAALKENFTDRSDALKREIARAYLSEKITQQTKASSDQELLNYYNAHVDELATIRASHILIKPADPSIPRSWEQAKAEAEALLKKIRADGAASNFDHYAKTYSMDEATKPRGGDLQFFSKKMMVPEFSDAAFALKNVGDVSDIVKTQFGYHIIKLTDDKRSFEEHKGDIDLLMNREVRKAKADQLLSELESKARVKLYENVLASAKTRNAPGTK